MAFRIREREEQRKAYLDLQKQGLVKEEAALFKKFKSRDENADVEFIKKLNSIHKQLKNDQEALELAKKLREEMNQQKNIPESHQKLLASVILELL